MNPKENLLASLSHKAPEWIPWLPLIDPANTPKFVPDEIRNGGSQLDRALYMREQLGCDLFIGGNVLKSKFQTTKVTEERHGEYIHVTYTIAGKSLKSVTHVGRYGEDGGEISYICEKPIKEPEDMETYASIIKDSYLEMDDKEFENTKAKMRNAGVVGASIPYPPIMNLVLNLMGLETFSYAIHDHQDKTENLLNLLHEENIRVFKIVSETNCEVAYGGGDVNSLLISPSMFKKYVIPTLSEYADILHKKGKIYMLHTCGYIKDFLKMFLDTGIDALHYVNPPPSGNTTISEARQTWKDKITIMAAIESVMLSRAKPDEVRKYVLNMLKEAVPGKSFLVMSSSKPDVPEENIRIIAKTMKEFNKYPLKA